MAEKIDIFDRLDAAEQKLSLINHVFIREYFSKKMSARLVGGNARLKKLIIDGKIRTVIPNPGTSSKWKCCASDVIRHVMFKP